MSHSHPILVTGAAGRVGAIGPAVIESLVKQDFAVRAMVRREDERSEALRRLGAKIVVGDLLDLDDMHRVVEGCRRIYFGMSVSAGYLEEDPYPRPTGLVPGTTTPYPPFANQGTAQPKADVRFDYDAPGDALWTFGAGYAGTDGIIHSGIGPFDIDRGSSLSYAKVGYQRGALQLTAFGNVLDGDADNLLTVGPNGRPIPLGFSSETFDLGLTHSFAAAERHLITWGANARTNSFDLTIAPEGDSRDELGAFLQGELALGERVRWLLGSRVDDIDVQRMLGALDVIRNSVQRAAESAMPHADFIAKFCPSPRDGH